MRRPHGPTHLQDAPWDRRASARRGTTLPPELKAAVKRAEAALGRVVAEAGGRALFGEVEAVRRLMVAFRESRRPGVLKAAAARLRRLSPARRLELARAYALYLEVVNACENAYRTHRLRQRPWESPGGRANLVYVLTAHPTESRSPANILLLRRVQGLLVEAFDRGAPVDLARLKQLLHLAWRVGTHPPHRPTVEDEARHLYSLLSDPILEELLSLLGEGHRVRLRSWVGGDKDGHPGVGPAQTRASLELSRGRLLDFALGRLLPELSADAALLDAGLARRAERLSGVLSDLRRLGSGDGGRVRALREEAARLARAYAAGGGAPHPRLTALLRLLEIFPGLVVPLELREERGRFKSGEPIDGMIRLIGRLARGGRVDWYARGLVVSMAESARDLDEAAALCRRALGAPGLPVIPLFETPAVLPRAARILAEAFKSRDFRAAALRHGERRQEVMVGYSDTAKRMGAFASRLAIREAMLDVCRWGRRAKVRVVFFHGAGGSEGRGGGTIEEQAATWPPGATETVKLTLQGEMVERTLASPEILRSQVLKVAAVQARPPAAARVSSLAADLARRAARAFQDTVSSPEFLSLVRRATPYARLGALHLGSRPSRRPGAGDGGMESLRAIPWVLCWTQARYLLPVWLGLGTAFRELRREGRSGELLRALKKDPLLRGFMRQLGFAVSKGEPLIWRLYWERLALDAAAAAERLERERLSAVELARAAAPGRVLLADRLWLKESIRLRAPMIHPLNLLQLELLAGRAKTEAAERLFRETVSGVAAGMLTTG